jgi:hypothetical protein
MPRRRRWPGLPLALVVAAVAAAAAIAATATATFSISNNKVGKGTKATLDITPRPHKSQSSTTLRVVRGVKFDPRAVSKLCTKPQADSNSCPAESRIGGGQGEATVTSNTNAFPPQHTTVAIDLFLAPPPNGNVVSGVVAHFKEKITGQEAHVTGTVKQLASGPFGYQNKFTGLASALKPPAGTTAHLDHYSITFGAHRDVVKNGKPVHYVLIRNPSTCPSSGWPFQLRIGYPDGTVDKADGSGACKN